MEILSILCTQTAIMFLYMAIGFVLYRTGLVTKDGSKALANLLLYIILPCVVIRSFFQKCTSENTRSLLISLLLGAGLLILSMIVCSILFRKKPIDQFGAAFSNAGFMGIPLITAVLGEEAVFYAAGFVALLNALQWTYGQWVLTGDRKNISARVVISNPIVISLIAGVLMYFSGIHLPGIILDVTKALSGMNAPVAMVIMGVYMAQADLKEMFLQKRLYWVSAVRLLLVPLLSVAVTALLPENLETARLALILAAAAPVGSNVAVYAQKQGESYTYAVQLVCVSTIFSVATMPAILAIAQIS